MACLLMGYREPIGDRKANGLSSQAASPGATIALEPRGIQLARAHVRRVNTNPCALSTPIFRVMGPPLFQRHGASETGQERRSACLLVLRSPGARRIAHHHAHHPACATV